MKKLFNKDNFLFSSFSRNQKRESLIITILLIVFYIFASFTLFNALYCFSNIIGSFVDGSADIGVRDLIRTLPIFISSLISIWALVILQFTYRNNSETLNKSLKIHSIILISISAFNVLYILINRFTGTFLSLVEGAPSKIYPLDALLFSLLYIAIGVFILIYLSRLQEKLPLTVKGRELQVKKNKAIYYVGMIYWLIIALFTFSGFTFGLFIIDFKHGYQFYSIALLLVYFIVFAFLGVWEFYYNNLNEEKRKTTLLPLALTGTIVSTLVIVLYFVAHQLNLYGPGNIGFGVLPVAFAASVNIVTMMVVFHPLVGSIIALIVGINKRKQK